MPTLKLDARAPEPESIARAGALIRAGRLVAFPTETVYGLGANALDGAAVQRIFAAKGRPSYNPLIAHVAGLAEAREIVSAWPEQAQLLAEHYWPGPLTLVLPRRGNVPDAVTAGLGTVAVRVPDHPVALALLRAAGVPIAAPSANLSGNVSPTTARHVAMALGDRVDLILDGGPCRVGIESTVLDLSGASPVLLRPGQIGVAELEALIGPLAASDAAVSDHAPRPAPGMLSRHYAPQAQVHLFAGEDWPQVEAAIEDATSHGRTIGLMSRSVAAQTNCQSVPMANDAALYARDLYAVLHNLDEAGCEEIWIEQVPVAPGWQAVRDRLQRAAHPT